MDVCFLFGRAWPGDVVGPVGSEAAVAEAALDVEAEEAMDTSVSLLLSESGSALKPVTCSVGC